MSDENKSHSIAAITNISQLKENIYSTNANSHLIQNCTLSLKTNPSKYTLARGYEQIKNAFLEIFLLSHSKFHNDNERQELLREKADHVRAEITSNMAKINKGLNLLTTKWEEELAIHEYKINDNYTNPIEIDFSIKVPEERDYLKLIESLDYFIIVLDNLWHYKEQTIEDKQRVTGDVINKFTGLVRNATLKAGVLRKIRLKKDLEDNDTKSETGENQTIEEINTDHKEIQNA